MPIGNAIGIPLDGYRISNGVWVPQELPNKELLLDNPFLETVGDAQPLSQWDDESGFNRHAIQATATNRPTVRLNADGIYEVVSDGVDDWMRSTFGATIVQPITIWCVGLIPTTNKVLYDGIISTNRNSLSRPFSGGTFNTFAGSTLVGPTANANLHSFVCIFNGATSSIRIDGSPTNGDAGVHSLTGLTILANFTPSAFGANVIRTLGVNSSVLSGNDLSSLETHMFSLVP